MFKRFAFLETIKGCFNERTAFYEIKALNRLLINERLTNNGQHPTIFIIIYRHQDFRLRCL